MIEIDSELEEVKSQLESSVDVADLSKKGVPLLVHYEGKVFHIVNVPPSDVVWSPVVPNSSQKVVTHHAHMHSGHGFWKITRNI